jgi:hypothetical protein
MRSAPIAFLLICAMPAAQARITRIEIIRMEPAFGGQVFGDTGA